MGEGNPGTLKVEPGNHPTMNSGLRPPAQELKGIGQRGGKKWFERTLGLIYLLQCGLSGPELWKTKTLPKEMRTSEQRGPGGGAKGIRKRCPGSLYQSNRNAEGNLRLQRQCQRGQP